LFDPPKDAEDTGRRCTTSGMSEGPKCESSATMPIHVGEIKSI